MEWTLRGYDEEWMRQNDMDDFNMEVETGQTSGGEKFLSKTESSMIHKTGTAQ